MMEERNEKSIVNCYGSGYGAFPGSMRRQLAARSYDCSSGNHGSSGCY